MVVNPCPQVLPTPPRRHISGCYSSLVNPDELLHEPETIRRSGVAFDYGEAVPDVGCVATGIRGPQEDVVSALSLSAPLRRFSSHEREFAAAVRGAAAKMSERLRSHGWSAWQVDRVVSLVCACECDHS
ncbi:IclR family transcriptional regulator C-terminal domain-containing protein [Streptomyces sp. NPDC058691]|uniref:IclR family transcriptional regulator domain-containing protein n=1 Tax=Streptomyces sp. NPDC058691 TaxID=3346601 RepID=UPI00365FD930